MWPGLLCTADDDHLRAARRSWFPKCSAGLTNGGSVRGSSIQRFFGWAVRAWLRNEKEEKNSTFPPSHVSPAEHFGNTGLRACPRCDSNPNPPREVRRTRGGMNQRSQLKVGYSLLSGQHLWQKCCLGGRCETNPIPQPKGRCDSNPISPQLLRKPPAEPCPGAWLDRGGAAERTLPSRPNFTGLTRRRGRCETKPIPSVRLCRKHGCESRNRANCVGEAGQPAGRLFCQADPISGCKLGGGGI